MNLVPPTSRNRGSSSKPWAGSLGELIFCAACCTVGAEVGKRVGRRSAPQLQRQLLDVSRDIQAYGERLIEQADAAREEGLTEHADAAPAEGLIEQASAAPADRPAPGDDGFGTFLKAAFGGLLVNAAKKFGAAVAKAGFGETAEATGEALGILGGAGIFVIIWQALEGKTSEPTPPTPPTPSSSPPPPPPPPPPPEPPSPPQPPSPPEPPSPPVWAGNGNGGPPGVPIPIPGIDGNGDGCFTPGTLVSTKRGLVPIQKIRVGDFVEAWNAVTSNRESRPVLRTSAAQADSLTTIRVGRQIVSCTPLHRFFTGTWTPAKDLRVGDRVLRLDGRWARVNRHSTALHATPVHNISVQDLRNYAVGRRGLIVHNDKLV